MLKKIIDWYFKPKSFEKSGKLYKYLGMGLIRKYWINGGSWWINQGMCPSMIKGKKNLESFISLTKSVEKVHALFFPALAVIGSMGFLDGNYAWIGIYAGLNYIVNVLPIMSQRYNRSRALSLVERLEKRNNSSS